MAEDVTFYFDPICPWTWLTSRWLLEVAAQRNLHIQWRSLSLLVLNGSVDNVPEQYRAPMLAARGAHRMIQSLLALGRNDDIGKFYSALGRCTFDAGRKAAPELLQDAASEAGVTDVLGAADDAQWDEQIEASTRHAVNLAGPDVGSPVLSFQEHAMFGPIVSPAPHGEEAVRIWDAFQVLAESGNFYEAKRGRRGPPQVA